MRITKIEIRNYKSINGTVTINFCNSLPTVLIGKNGSGKTNILEALHAIAEANGSYFGAGKELPQNYRAYIRLEKSDAQKLFPGKSVDEECEFIACSGENGRIGRIESEYLVSLLKAEIEEITNLADQLKDALETYKKQLNKIACRENDQQPEQPLRGYQITGFRSAVTNYDILKMQVQFVLEQAEKLAGSIGQIFSAGDHAFSIENSNADYWLNTVDMLYFKLRYVKPDLAPFEEKFITINETAIKREIAKINKATKASCDKITLMLHELADRAKRLRDALTDDRPIPNHSGTFYSFIREVRKCVGTKCAFLRNESSAVIFGNDAQALEYLRSDRTRTILQAYLDKIYHGSDKGEIQTRIRENKDFSLPEAALKKFGRSLNANIPAFENGMYDRISVEQSGGKIPTILLHEKSGATVPLDSTSAGRQWYFTYYFLKNTLAPGDLFVIDEPAAMLHPIAQKEILNELLELGKQGITVVYSTHSPYLIPKDWESVHFVAMTDGGTTVTQENKSELLKQVTGGDIFALQELLDKYQRCDKESVAHQCYYQALACFKTIEEAAKQLNLSESTVESWRKKISSKKFRCPRLETIIVIAGKTQSNITDLLEPQ